MSWVLLNAESLEDVCRCCGTADENCKWVRIYAYSYTV